MNIPFNKPYLTGKETEYLNMALAEGHLLGNGSFTKKCQLWMEETLQTKKVLLNPSGTGSLEMAALLADIRPGDEIIMPSFTFVSTANAFVLRGGIPVFVDIRADTLNIDENQIEAAITKKTKAIVPVHYAGISCAMEKILEIAVKHHLLVIEDAAHGVMARYKGKYLGTIGDLGAFSFHGTKNIICGEGGAILINDEKFSDLAEVLWEKGTNRSKFMEGLVDKYTWVELGSSFLAGELPAAFLLAQLENSKQITSTRVSLWNTYQEAFAPLERKERIKRPTVPEGCDHNGHIYYILLQKAEQRVRLIQGLKEKGIGTAFHYVPLHSSPAGRKFGRAQGDLARTSELSERLLRMPLWPSLGAENIARVVDEVSRILL